MTVRCDALTDPDFTSQVAADVVGNLTQAGVEVLSAPGLSTHIDFVNSTTYEGQLEAAGKVYLDWYMLTQARGPWYLEWDSICDVEKQSAASQAAPRRSRKACWCTHEC